MKKQILQKKKSYADQLKICSTWQEVMNLRNMDDQRWQANVVLAEPSWLESFSNEDGLYADADEEAESERSYSDLYDEIAQILTPEELEIFLLSAQGDGSLRWVADMVDRSHEYTRAKLVSAKKKLKETLQDKWRY